MQGQVKVVPARWWHVPALSRLIRDTRRRPGGEAAVLWYPQWSPTLGLIQSAWPVPVPGVAGPRSFVAESGGRAVGLAQMRPLEEPRQWEVVFLAVELPQAGGRGTANAGGGPAPLLFVPDRRAAHLLGELCDTGVELGAERIVARVEEGGGRYELFKQVGFSPVVREYDYFLPAGEAVGRVTGAGAVDGLRPQRRADSYGLLQLYQGSTPKLVQMAEGKRSRSWDLPVAGWGGRLARGRAERRWVVERDARKVGWLRLQRLGRGQQALRQAELLIDPQTSGLAPDLLALALTAGGASAGGLLVRAREYQQGLLAALEESGFTPLGSRLLMVKQLAAAVRQPLLVPALEKVV
jgi:hypothetical protein